jgi:hypothetical protein
VAEKVVESDVFEATARGKADTGDFRDFVQKFWKYIKKSHNRPAR